ncbi:hypothetical protein AAVH_07623 [Aphelenchoides avenae]|nr:hypothetical protein AAVH_07623 [Aphelenchus avenae]
MKALCLLTFTAAATLVALADESSQCIDQCFWASTMVDEGFFANRVSAVQHRSHRRKRALVTRDESCSVLDAWVKCVAVCPSGDFDGVVIRYASVAAKYCSSDMDELTGTLFWQEGEYLMDDWLQQEEACPDGDPFEAGVERYCQIHVPCTFGRALDAVRQYYSDDVTDATVAFYQFFNGVYLKNELADQLPVAYVQF